MVWGSWPKDPSFPRSKGDFPVGNNLLGGAGSLGYGELVSETERVGPRVGARANEQ